MNLDLTGSFQEKCKAIYLVSNEFFVAGGARESDKFLARIYKIDESRKILFEKDFPVIEHASAQAIADAGDGNIFVAGWTGDKSGGYGFPFPTFPWIMKIDGQGDTIWEISDASQTDKIYSLSFINDLAKTSGGGVILIGMQNFAPLIIKLDKDGKVEWKNRVVHLYGEGFSIVESKKDGFLAVGALNHDFTFAIGTRGDAWLAKFDKSGNITWEKFYGGCDADMLFSLIEVEDGRIIAGGTRDVSAERVMSLLICLICTMELSLLIKRRETF